MPSNFTANYQLNQWVKDDQVRMEDFNADNAKIDAAVAAVDQRVDDLSASKADISNVASEVARLDQAVGTKVEMAIGTYTGDGSEQKLINLGRKPKLVFTATEYCEPNSGTVVTGGMATPDCPLIFRGHPALTIADTGFYVYYHRIESGSYIGTNSESAAQRYVAFF